MIRIIFDKIKLSVILVVEVILLILIAIVLLTKEPGNAENSNSIESYEFIVMTKSAPESLEDREFLRHQSWLSYDWKNDQQEDISWRHFFLVGLSMNWARSEIQNENNTYGDIIEAPKIDSYRRMTYKLMWSFQYLIDNYNFKFLVINSEDTIVNVNMLDKFFSQVKAAGNESMFHGGCKCFPRTVMRVHPKGIQSERVWPQSLFSNYCLGTGLISSRDAIQELLRWWYIDRQPISGLDDVQIGFQLFSSTIIPIRELWTVSYGCEVDKRNASIITMIKPYELGAQLLRNYMETGTYCTSHINAHAMDV